jgi:pimeloyl-ACP methyl ester carboxylesterase
MRRTSFSSHARIGIICSTLTCAVLFGVASCATRAAPPATAATTSTAVPVKANRSGTLVTYKSGHELWRETYRDDGETLVSQLSLGGRSATVRTSRTSRKVEVEADGERVERDIPAGTVALENGDWQAYAIAAEWYADAAEPRPVKVLVPGQGAVVDGTISVANASEGRRNVKLTIGPLAVATVIDVDGKVVEARVAAQGLEVRPPGIAARGSADAPSPSGSTPIPANVTPHSVEVQQDGGTLAGELWIPKSTTGPVPLVVVVPGSGPTDRDGNSKLGLRPETYKQLAAALAERGIATLRYDKRGVGQSQTFREDGMTLATSSRDLAAIVQAAQSKGTFASTTLVGHSEGGVVALKSMTDVHPHALVLVATPGRTLGTVLREQLVKQGVAASEVEKALLEVRKGDAVSSTRPVFKVLFRPSVLPFVRSLIDVDPVTLLRGTTFPVVIVQGDSDRQIAVEDAELLHTARVDARVVVVHGMNHVLKDDATELQRSYTDPTVALAPTLVDAIASAARH